MADDRWKFQSRFGRDADLAEIAKSYRIGFGQNGAKQYLLPDLAEFCGVGRPLPEDPGKAQRAAGRQDVWLRIQQFLNFPEDEVYAMLRGEPIIKQP